MEINTAVLIGGGSTVGLSMALFLSHHGVPCMVVEQNPAPSPHFRFRGIAARTMELYRGTGIEADIWAATTEDQRLGGVARAKNLADEDVTWLPVPWTGIDSLSPCTSCTCDQDQLEPVLHTHAARRGAEVRYHTELSGFEQDDHGISAVIRDTGDGTEHIVHASYLVAADGTHSPIRAALGIPRHGHGVIEHRLSMIFRTDLDATLHGRRLTACITTDINGSIVPRASGIWLMSVPYYPEKGERPEDFAGEHGLALIRAATGRPDLPATILDVHSWQAAAFVADRFRLDRVFLAGDAAHVMPPTGGFGGNTGIQDAHNLAWKLAAVIGGTAGPALLDTYEAERIPVVNATVNQSLIRLRSWFGAPVETQADVQRDDNAVMLGYRYSSPAMLDDGASADGDIFEDPRHPSGRAGSRAPHVWLDRLGDRLSTLDLFGREFVLLAGADAQPWLEAGEQIAAKSGFGLASYQVGADRELIDVDDRWTGAYGVTSKDAVLVRPDGFIAWRSPASAYHPVQQLGDALTRLGLRLPGDQLR